MNQKAMSILIDNDEEDDQDNKLDKKKKIDAFRINPILLEAKEEMKDHRDSMTTVMDKNNVVGFTGMNFMSKNSEMGNLGDISPVKKNNR